jgi:hemophore-related protein
MATFSLTRLGAAAGGLALSLTVGAGVGAADPNLDPIINTTCTYPQVMAALNAEQPQAAQQLNSSPTVQSLVRNFLDSPPDQRQQVADELGGNPAAQKYMGVIQEVAGTCGDY